jgi:hypothetical protein
MSGLLSCLADNSTVDFVGFCLYYVCNDSVKKSGRSGSSWTLRLSGWCFSPWLYCHALLVVATSWHFLLGGTEFPAPSMYFSFSCFPLLRKLNALKNRQWHYLSIVPRSEMFVLSIFPTVYTKFPFWSLLTWLLPQIIPTYYELYIEIKMNDQHRLYPLMLLGLSSLTCNDWLCNVCDLAHVHGMNLWWLYTE